MIIYYLENKKESYKRYFKENWLALLLQPFFLSTIIIIGFVPIWLLLWLTKQINMYKPLLMFAIISGFYLALKFTLEDLDSISEHFN